MHHASVHSTMEERQTYKYYCNTCDLVFFCEAYYNKHNEGIRHKNMLKAIEYQLKMNNFINNQKNNLNNCSRHSKNFVDSSISNIGWVKTVNDIRFHI
jgi:hypothetical protein